MTKIESNTKNQQPTYQTTSEFLQLQTAALNFHSKPKFHLKQLLKDSERCDGLVTTHTSSISDYNHTERSILLDYSRQLITGETVDLLFQYADKLGLSFKINQYQQGINHINASENRRVLHFVLRMPKDYDSIITDENDINVKILEEVHAVLYHIESFSQRVRKGEYRGVTNKEFNNVICVGIGGSQLGPECIYEALKFNSESRKESKGRILRFISNVDPVDFVSVTYDLNPEETLVIVVSKTFSTVETMLNAKSCKNWLVQNLQCFDILEDKIISQHMIAVSTVTKPCLDFGIRKTNIFPFWPWVGGRFSVTSAVGILPLSIQYSYKIMEKFLAGAHDMDEHFFNTPLRDNIPVLLGILGVWNSTFMKFGSRVILPYSQALQKFVNHVQQVEMESNGKRVTQNGETMKYYGGEIIWGECGTNGQHSFYQLLHQGRIVPSEFIGFIKNPVIEDKNNKKGNNDEKIDIDIKCSEKVIHGNTSDISTSYNFNTNTRIDTLEDNLKRQHDELMANFFAQPDALAYGKTLNDLKDEGVPEDVRPHNVFPGNRPSSTLLFTQCDAFSMGQLIALYEHRVTIQGFLWDLNSFDQWGVQLGKTLAKKVRDRFTKTRRNRKEEKVEAGVQGFNSSTTNLLTKYLSQS